MASVVDLINLIAVVFLVSGGLAALLSVGAGKKDVSHLMLPDEIQRHPREWGAYTIESAKFTPSGYFQLVLRSNAGELLEMLIQQLHDVVVSSLYDPRWFLPVSGAFTLASEDERTPLSDWFFNSARQRMTDLGMEETQTGAEGICLEVVQGANQDRVALDMTLNDVESSQVVWQGRAFATAEDHRWVSQTDETPEDSLQRLFDMLATRKPPADTLKDE